MKKKIVSLAAAFVIALGQAGITSGSCTFSASAADSVTYQYLDPSFNGGEPIKGVDISTIVSLENSGVKFYNENGQEQDIFKTLADNGVNYIRVRVWNEPNDGNGHTYGGGNSDVDTAGIIGKRAAQYGMKLLVDIHYSDFWADPAKQTRPKYWAPHSHDKLKGEIYNWTKWVVEHVTELGGDIGMVQVGNETQCFFCGEKDMYKICDLFSSGEKAVRDFNRDILICHHFTNPESGYFDWYAKVMKECSLDYDVFATSYYPYWHGSLDNLRKELKNIADKYGKYVMVAETAYPYTNEDGDAFPDSVKQGSSGATLSYPVSVDGQAQAITDVFRTVAETGSKGIGVFYWEPAWIGLPSLSYEQQKENWNKYGSGWASDAAGEYDKDATGAGGSGFDNQAMFDFSGKPLESLKLFTQIYPRKEKPVEPVQPVQEKSAEVPEGLYRIKNAATGRYLTAEGGRAENGRGVVQYEADGAADYNSWYIKKNGEAYSIVSSSADKGISLGFTDSGAGLSQGDSQSCVFIEREDGSYLIAPAGSSDSALGTDGDGNGSRAGRKPRSGERDQLWILEPVERFRITGDINGDGAVDVFDLVYLRQRLISETKEADCDLNDDGEVNVADLTTISLFLMGRGEFSVPTHGTPPNTIIPE